LFGDFEDGADFAHSLERLEYLFGFLYEFYLEHVLSQIFFLVVLTFGLLRLLLRLFFLFHRFNIFLPFL